MLEEQPHLADQVRRFHGDTLVWAGQDTQLAGSVSRCMVRNCFYAAARGASAHPELASFECEVSALSLPSHSIDGFVLHHALELERDPRRALREVARVVVPGGRIVVCAFNALSVWGIRSFYGRFRDDAFSSLRFINPLRLFDWLAVLGFELDEEVSYLGYQLPFSWSKGRGRVSEGLRHFQPPIGGIYIISAVKQTLGGRVERRNPALGSRKLAPVAYPRIGAWNRVGRDG
ncbi:MAG: methyltransferase domain-containing protein [Pseudomonadales bacterium]|nr:methyltransferase domain-containing protein [Pseudomonadales bacterium]MDP6826117.1 methyltransferase domain-containing protein [Pseudomonadales bacterium]MDP6971507.1 methyltransferase domain-containing protein [Pseudomonadales bacterium]